MRGLVEMLTFKAFWSKRDEFSGRLMAITIRFWLSLALVGVSLNNIFGG